MAYYVRKFIIAIRLGEVHLLIVVYVSYVAFENSSGNSKHCREIENVNNRCKVLILPVSNVLFYLGLCADFTRLSIWGCKNKTTKRIIFNE